MTAYKFALYFDGVQQTSGFEFSPLTGQVTFTAASGVIVSADYFYDWTAETFSKIVSTGTYPDRRFPVAVQRGTKHRRCDCADWRHNPNQLQVEG